MEQRSVSKSFGLPDTDIQALYVEPRTNQAVYLPKCPLSIYIYTANCYKTTLHLSYNSGQHHLPLTRHTN